MKTDQSSPVLFSSSKSLLVFWGDLTGLEFLELLTPESSDDVSFFDKKDKTLLLVVVMKSNFCIANAKNFFYCTKSSLKE